MLSFDPFGSVKIPISSKIGRKVSQNRFVSCIKATAVLQCKKVHGKWYDKDKKARVRKELDRTIFYETIDQMGKELYEGHCFVV